MMILMLLVQLRRTTMNRLENNRVILEKLGKLIETYPDQRFGQLIANYIFPKYREEDIFWEESEVTAHRLT